MQLPVLPSQLRDTQLSSCPNKRPAFAGLFHVRGRADQASMSAQMFFAQPIA